MSRYLESPDGGTRHAYFGGVVPKGWRVVEGDIPGPAPAARVKDVYEIARESATVADFLTALKAEAAKRTP